MEEVSIKEKHKKLVIKLYIIQAKRMLDIKTDASWINTSMFYRLQ